MSPRAIAVLTWTARGLSILLALLVLMMFLGDEGPYRQAEPLTLAQHIGLVFFPWGVLIGTLLAWRWPRAGSIIAIGCIPALFLSQAWLGGGIPLSAGYLVPLIPAFLFLALSFAEHKPGARARA